MRIRSSALVLFTAIGLSVGLATPAHAFTGDATFFVPGLGACGRVNLPTDLVASLPAVMFDPSPGGNPNQNKNCGRKIKVDRGSRSVVATIVDRCPECKRGDIDLSPAAFMRIASLTEGRVKVSWKFI